ncbi:hypothetical protein ACOMHN_003668 [Nucella lapillus]
MDNRHTEQSSLTGVLGSLFRPLQGEGGGEAQMVNVPPNNWTGSQGSCRVLGCCCPPLAAKGHAECWAAAALPWQPRVMQSAGLLLPSPGSQGSCRVLGCCCPPLAAKGHAECWAAAALPWQPRVMQSAGLLLPSPGSQGSCRVLGCCCPPLAAKGHAECWAAAALPWQPRVMQSAGLLLPSPGSQGSCRVLGCCCPPPPLPAPPIPGLFVGVESGHHCVMRMTTITGHVTTVSHCPFGWQTAGRCGNE